MLKLDTDLSYKAKWYNFETDEEIDEPDATAPCLKIKPQPFSNTDLMFRNKALVLSGADQCEKFKDALVDMCNIIGADDQPLPCTDAVKQKIYDFQLGGIADYVLAKLWSFHKKREAQEKNS